jgi:hypothetical protein
MNTTAPRTTASRSRGGPAQRRLPVDADTADQGGTTERVFISAWRGDILLHLARRGLRPQGHAALF